MFLRLYQILGAGICGLFVVAAALGWKLPESAASAGGARSSGGHHSFWHFGK